jgi:hypothetical protein
MGWPPLRTRVGLLDSHRQVLLLRGDHALRSCSTGAVHEMGEEHVGKWDTTAVHSILQASASGCVQRQASTHPPRPPLTVRPLELRQFLKTVFEMTSSFFWSSP